MNIRFVQQMALPCLSLMICLVSKVYAAPGELSNEPLFLGEQVDPNVLFIVDDSGSMENELLLTQGALSDSRYRTHDGSGGPTEFNITPPYNDLDKLRMCVGYNALAFNPKGPGAAKAGISPDNAGAGGTFPTNDAILYVPWPGSDIAGNSYDHQNIQSARDFVYGKAHNDIDNTLSKNLLSDDVGYTQWIDDDGDGEFDQGECGETNHVDQASIDTVTIDPEHFISTNAMSETMRQNFANWYTYYRKRRFVLNAPMLDILNSIDMRVGLATINNESRAGLIIQHVDAPAVDNPSESHREELIRRFQGIGSGESTPLRRPLENAGRYFAGEPVDEGFVGPANPGSPILSAADGGACQHNYTMLLTDGFSNEKSDTRPRAASDSSIGNADGDNNSDFDGTPTIAGETFYFGDNFNNTMADIAMHYYETDLKPGTDYPALVRSNNPLDSNEQQHMVTYTVAFGVKGDIPVPVNVTAETRWPQASDNSFWQGEKKSSIDDLLHAAYNGRGKFLSALNGSELKNSLEDVINSISAASQGTAASVGFNTSSITADTTLYQPSFSSDGWQGTIRGLDFSTGVVNPDPVFDVGKQLVERILDDTKGHSDRNIITYNGSMGVPFRFPQNMNAVKSDELSETQINDLLTNFVGDASDKQSYGNDIVAYLRGDIANIAKNGEVNRGFRDRGTFKDINNVELGPSVLGDIIHASPVYVGAPNEPYPNYIEGSAAPYFDFLELNKNRRPMLYAGANDGMLHGFDANTGDELFAYIPNLLFSEEAEKGLHWLADPAYKHLAYVDETPSIADVFDGSKWRTYLAGALRSGGRGIYVIDITDPDAVVESEAENIPVLEFTHPNLGFTYGTPRIAKLNNDKWAVIFGNGYNQSAAGDGAARLFIVYLDGSGSIRISTNVGTNNGFDCTSAMADCNGLSSPTVLDLNNDGVADRVYAGDLHGNMWAFDISDSDDNNWGIAHGSSLAPEPLFTACSVAGSTCSVANRQPITQKPEVVTHGVKVSPTTSPNLFVLFGTGQLLTENDLTDTSLQSFYAVWDSGNTNGNGGLLRNNLTEQTITTNTTDNTRTLSENDVNYSLGVGGNYGWYIDLPATRERSFISPIVIGEVVLFATSIPNVEMCSAEGGGFIMAASVFNGRRPSFGVFSDPDISGIGIDEFINGFDTFSDIPNNLVVPSTPGGAGDPEKITTSPPSQSRRASWSIIR